MPWNQLRFFFLCSPLDAADVARLPDRPDAYQTGVRWPPLESLPLEPVLPQVSRRLIAALAMPDLPPLIVSNPH